MRLSLVSGDGQVGAGLTGAQDDVIESELEGSCKKGGQERFP